MDGALRDQEDHHQGGQQHHAADGDQSSTAASGKVAGVADQPRRGEAAEGGQRADHGDTGGRRLALQVGRRQRPRHGDAAAEAEPGQPQQQ
ncbi:hypothetical protein D9M71_600360 [compost metagenome]